MSKNPRRKKRLTMLANALCRRSHEHSVATFLVENLDKMMSDLRSRGVSFEEYDKPDLKTDNGVYSDQSGFKACWFKDPEGKHPWPRAVTDQMTLSET